MVVTITVNREVYFNCEFSSATEAREGLSVVGNPSFSYYVNMVCYGLIRNFPVTPEAVTIANTFFGTDDAYLKGKTTIKASELVVT